MWSLTHTLQLAQKIRLDQVEKFIPPAWSDREAARRFGLDLCGAAVDE
jgi:hypothetical protein